MSDRRRLKNTQLNNVGSLTGKVSSAKQKHIKKIWLIWCAVRTLARLPCFARPQVAVFETLYEAAMFDIGPLSSPS